MQSQLQVLDFLVLGAQKCATSWLYYCLREHPEIHLPRAKREEAYLGGDLCERHGVEWYFTSVSGAAIGQVRGDVSVDYILDPRSPRMVRTYLPDVRMVLSIRDPVDRAISAYYWSVRKRNIPDLTLDRGLEIALEAYRGGFRGRDDLASYRDIIERGFYDQQIRRYLNHFPTGQLLVITHDEVVEDPRLVLRRVYEFLGVDGAFSPRRLRRRPKKNSYSRALIRLERLGCALPSGSRAISKIADYANRVVGSWPSRPEARLSHHIRQALAEEYRAHVCHLQDVLETMPTMNRPPFRLTHRWKLGI